MDVMGDEFQEPVVQSQEESENIVENENLHPQPEDENGSLLQNKQIDNGSLQQQGFHGQPFLDTDIDRSDIRVVPDGSVIDPQCPIPVVVGNSEFYYEYLAFLGTTSKSRPNLKLLASTSANPEWMSLLAVNPDEKSEMSEFSKSISAETNLYDPKMRFLGIDSVCAESSHMMSIAFNLMAEVEPVTYQEALQRWDSDEWQKATFAELNQLRAMGCYEVVPVPHDAKVIKSRIVYKLKLDKEGKPLRYKARIVAKGFQQRYGIEYINTFSATAHPTAIRMMLALAAQNGWLTNSTDIQNAFIFNTNWRCNSVRAASSRT